jgi:hypothetical protein
MPTLMAGLVSSLAGWLIEDAIQPYLGMAGAAGVSLVVSMLVFVRLRRWLRDLRSE